jgi:hemophore-related protein
MSFSVPSCRRALTGAVGVGAVAGAMLFGAIPSALADQGPNAAPPPNCTAGDLEQVRAEVAAGRSAYLFTHPDVNDFFTSLQGQTRDQKRSKVKAYLASNPQIQDELAGVDQPLVDARNRCGIPQMPTP